MVRDRVAEAKWTSDLYPAVRIPPRKTDDPAPSPSLSLKAPTVLLSGSVDYAMYKDFRQQFAPAHEQDLIVIELSTLGGDPEVARMMGEDVR